MKIERTNTSYQTHKTNQRRCWETVENAPDGLRLSLSELRSKAFLILNQGPCECDNGDQELTTEVATGSAPWKCMHHCNIRGARIRSSFKAAHALIDYAEDLLTGKHSHIKPSKIKHQKAARAMEKAIAKLNNAKDHLEFQWALDDAQLNKMQHETTHPDQ